MKVDYNYVIFDDKDIQITEQLFMPTEVQEGSPASLFRRASKRDGMMGRYFKNSVYLKDGSRISGVSENDIQDPLLGYDKNNQPFTIRREYLRSEDIVTSKDNDRTAKILRKEIDEGRLYRPDDSEDVNVRESQEIWEATSRGSKERSENNQTSSTRVEGTWF